MNIVILSRNKNLYSTRRLIEEAENRGHDVEVIDPLKCDIICSALVPLPDANIAIFFVLLLFPSGKWVPLFPNFVV